MQIKKNRIATAFLFVGVLGFFAVWWHSAEENNWLYEGHKPSSDRFEKAGELGLQTALISQMDGDPLAEVVDQVGFLQDPFRGSVFSSRLSGVADPHTLYFENIEAAQSGNKSAMLQVARALRGCEDGFRAPSQAQLFELYEQALIDFDRYEHLLRATQYCEPMAQNAKAALPELASKNIVPTIADYWLDKAAALGDSKARLLRLADLPLQDDEVAQLLDTLLPSLDPEVFERAAAFDVGRAYPEDKAVLEQRWLLLGCRAHESCSAAVYSNNLSNTYSPTEVAQILKFVEEFASGEDWVGYFSSLHKQRPHRYNAAIAETYVKHLQATGNLDAVGVDGLAGFKFPEQGPP